MTGFGQAESKTSQGFIRVEIKATNHKFFEISCRLPVHLSEFEDAIRKTAGQELKRGKVSLFVTAPDPSVFSSRLVLNEKLAKEVFANVQKLKNLLKLKDLSSAVVLREVLRHPDVLVKDVSGREPSAMAKELMKTVREALSRLNRSKAAEGRALEKDLKGRLLEIKKALSAVVRRIPRNAKEYRASLILKMKDFLKDGQLDKERLTVEVAQYVKNSDVSEEVTRLQSHLDAMAKALNEDGELGRKIDFIAQEMVRETNTLGAKSSDTVIAAGVIQIKSAIEKIREQAQNVE